MSNVNTVLNAVMSAGVSALAAAVKTDKKLQGEIFASSLTVSAVAAYRIGKAWNGGETVDVKETKFANAKREFLNFYMAAGNAVWRDSETLKEFRSLKLNKDAAKEGPLVRAYVAAAKAGKFTKKEHAIAEVERFSKKIIDDATKNHAPFLKQIGAKENVAEIIKVWGEFVETTYGTTVYALNAYFKTETAATGSDAVDPMEKAVTKLLEITSVEELAAMIRRLTARKDELETSSVKSTAIVNAGRATDDKPAATETTETERKAA